MTDEFIDICDENNNLLGIHKMKSEAHRMGLWHRTVHIWIYNSKRELLLQLRAKEKDLYPDMWDISAAGHVSAGEEPLISGLREIKEEIGLVVDKKDLELLWIKKSENEYRKIINKEFCYVYLMKFDEDIKKLKIQDEEVQEIKFLPLDEIESELRGNKERYVPHPGYWERILDEVKERLKIKI